MKLNAEEIKSKTENHSMDDITKREGVIVCTAIPFLKTFSWLNFTFDVIFSVAGLALFGVNLFFIVMMMAALASTLYISWFTNEMTLIRGETYKTHLHWFLINYTIVWRYAMFKLALIFGFILVAVIESAHIDVMHTLLHLPVSMSVIAGVLSFVALLMLAIALYVAPMIQQVPDMACTMLDRGLQFTNPL